MKPLSHADSITQAASVQLLTVIVSILLSDKKQLLTWFELSCRINAVEDFST